MEQPNSMTRITYTKVFVAGTLAGLTARCWFDTDDVAHAMKVLAAMTPANPGRDSSGSRFWVSNLGCIEAQYAEAQEQVARMGEDVCSHCHETPTACDCEHGPARR